VRFGREANERVFKSEQRTVEGWIISQIFNRCAGMCDSRPVPQEDTANLTQGETERHMSEVHRDLTGERDISRAIPSAECRLGNAENGGDTLFD
jgi:hypothetical protein